MRCVLLFVVDFREEAQGDPNHQGTRLCIPSEFQRIPTEVGQKSPAGRHGMVPEQAAECAIILS